MEHGPPHPLACSLRSLSQWPVAHVRLPPPESARGASPTTTEDARLADLLGWTPTIEQGCVDNVAHALYLKIFKQCGARACSLPHSTIRGEWEWLHTRLSTPLGFTEVPQDFMANPHVYLARYWGLCPRPRRGEGRQQGIGGRTKWPHTPQNMDPKAFL